MSRVRITFSETIEIGQEDLQEAALNFPTVLMGVRHDAAFTVSATSDPEHAAQLLGFELHNQLLMLLRNHHPVIREFPTVEVEQLPD
ncbi:hypothetical protein M707_21905 [Arthrobacter sp. AK-YN10]|nr:hypothetical protein M707_21905 [Arthrobacter sp. AK-YN10]